MGTKKDDAKTDTKRKQRPAIDLDAREKQMCALAISEAERLMREGKASSQIITHYLKLAASTTRLEKENMELDNELKAAKTEKLKADKRADEMFEKAIMAMGIYRGTNQEDV